MNTKVTNLETLSIWNAHHAELQEARNAASNEASEASEVAKKARGYADHLRKDLDFYEKPRDSNERRSGGSQADHDRLRDELPDAKRSLSDAETIEQTALKNLADANKELEKHIQAQPAITKDDIKAASEKVADLREDKARVEQRLLEMEGQDDDGPIADASTSVEKARQHVEEVAAANSLGEASDTEVKHATGTLAKAEDALKKSRASSASRAQAIAGLKRRLESTERQLTEAEAVRRLAVIEYSSAFHRQGVSNLNKAMAAPAFSHALTDIAIADRLLRHVRSEFSLLGGSPGLQIDAERYTHISGFDSKRIIADPCDTQVAALVEELGLTI